MARKRVLITGAAGYLSGQLLPVFRSARTSCCSTAENRTISTTSSRSISSIGTSTPIASTSKASTRSFTTRGLFSVVLTLTLTLTLAIGMALSDVANAQGGYLGCFADNPRMAPAQTGPEPFPGRVMNSFCFSSERRYPTGNCVVTAPMTVAICAAGCRARGFDFAGVQYGNWCFCGASPGVEASSGRCNMPCAGNPAEICGGFWANSVYRTDGGARSLADRTPAPRQSNPSSTSGASGSPPTSTAGSMPRHWQGTGDAADCAAANNSEKNTASYYDMCVWPTKGKGEVRRNKPSYIPPLDPRRLVADACSRLSLPPGVSCSYDAVKRQCDAQFVSFADEAQRCMIDVSLDLYVRTRCGSVTAPRERRECMMDAKAAFLLAEEPAVRRICSRYSGDNQRQCIDTIFRSGPIAERRAATQIEILDARPRDQSSASPPAVPNSTPSDGPSWRGTGCPPGQGMKPTPGGFGSWSCQPLGVFVMPGNAVINPAGPAGAARVEAFERDLTNVVRMVAAAAADAESDLSADERQTCLPAAVAAGYAILKGGVADVPEKCQGMAARARSELAHYAAAHVSRVDRKSVV